MMEFKRKFDQRRDARKTQRPKTFDPATDEADFQRKLDAFMEDMDGIVSPRPPSSGPEGSASSAPSPYETTPEWIDSTSSALQELATVPYDQTRQGLPTDVDELLLLPMRQERRTLLNDEPEELSPIPQKPKYQDLKLYTVDEKSVPFTPVPNFMSIASRPKTFLQVSVSLWLAYTHMLQLGRSPRHGHKQLWLWQSGRR